MYDFIFLQLQANGEEGGSLLCMYLIILGIIVLALYLGLYVFTKFFADKTAKQHPCRYCGHIVDSVSDCCQAPVQERFGGGKCMKCRKEAKIICSKCRRPIH